MYDDMSYITVFSAVFRVTFCVAFCVAVILSPYHALTIGLQQAEPGHGRRRPKQAAKRGHGIRGYMATGHHENTGIGVRGGRQSCTAHNRNKLAAHGAGVQA